MPGLVEFYVAAQFGGVFAIALLIAFAIDHFLGEPPARLHPVVWMGIGLN